MASMLCNRQDVEGESGWRSQMFCSGEQCISGKSYGRRYQLASGILFRQGGIEPISLSPPGYSRDHSTHILSFIDNLTS